MPKTKTTPPIPTKEKGQRSIELDLYLTRHVPFWGNPGWMDGKVWREVVKRQPIAIDCRETLIANLIALDWKIEPKDSTQRDEHKKDIEYYTNFLTHTQELDYTEILEWLLTDLLDIPFGCGAEVIREGDRPDGRVVSLIPLDGATLFPTLNKKWPIGQFVAEAIANQNVYFPKHAINRIYISPRPDIKREGWGLAPPEKIYLALELLNRGDYYYANLLVDTPAAGILDLGDMAKDSAELWVKSWRKMLAGIDPFKIPVLYEHDTAVNWIPFTKSPVELMFDKAIFRYGALVAAGYGMSLSDLGIPTGVSGGETLAGSIRDERKTRKTGFARIKKKVKYFFDRLLPETLEFKFVDLDDELNVALGRARLATATSGVALVTAGVFTAEEWRQQMIADGLMTISLPEKLPTELKNLPLSTGKPDERPGMLGGAAVPPSSGGHGEVKSDVLMSAIFRALFVDDVYLLKKAYSIFLPLKVQADSLREVSSDLSEIWYEEILDGEQPSEMTEMFLDVIKSNYGDKLFTAFERDLIVGEIKALLEGISLEKEESKQKGLFIKGEIDDLEEIEVIVFDDLSDELADWLEEIINDTLEKSVLLGTFRFALENPDSNLDNLIDGNVVNYIRNQVDTNFNDILISFTNRISDIILENAKGDCDDNKIESG